MAMLPRMPGTPVGHAERRINRAPSPLLARAVPWGSVLFASMLPFSPVIASAPVMPPLGFMIFLAWRTLRPGLLPIWAGLPLGAWDDLYNGQPFGGGIMLWSAAMLAMEVIDERYLWRGFVQDWLATSALLSGYLLASSAIDWLATGYPLPLTIGPLWLMTLVLFPVVTKLVALLDRLRLMPFPQS